MLLLPSVAQVSNLLARYLTVVVLLLMMAQVASADTLNVNSTADILNPPAGVVTLRSAIQAANSRSGGNTINLTVAGVYKITIPGANTGTNSSGAFAILPGGGNLTIVNTSGGRVVIDGNKLDRVFDINPGASASPAFTVTMHGFTISNGLAQQGDLAMGSGGGIRAKSVASLTLTGMVVTGNEATADGGGIAMENQSNSTWVLTISNSTISNNHAGDSGGGIDGDGTGSIVINSGSVISGNTALNDGGGILLDLAFGPESPNLTMQATLVSDNKALGSSAIGGGGIANFGSGTVSMTDSKVQNNSSAAVGGGYAKVNCVGTLSVSSSAFLGNTAANGGGAIFACGPTIVIAFSQIDGNSTGGAGGGIFIGAGTPLTVRNSTIANNTAGQNGGGVELQTSGTGSSGSSITNCTITNNSANNNAAVNGGGLDASAGFTGTLNLTNVTISGNFAGSGGGIFWAGATGSAINLVNTIVANNSASSTGPDANNPAGTFTDGGGNLIGISGAGSGNTGFTAPTTQTGTTGNPLDPHLGPLQNNGGPTQTLALLSGSPAIDKGLTTSVTADQRGVRRPQGTKFDVGAYEFNQGPTPSASVSASSLDFGSQGLGTSASEQVTITDNGTGALTLSNVTLAGANAGDFSFTPPSDCVTLPATIQPNGFCGYKVTFKPLSTGSRTAELTFIDNHLNAPNSQQIVALSGTGIIRVNSSVSLALTTGTNPSGFGTSLTFTATVTPNTATGTVTFFDGTTINEIGAISGGAATFTTSSLAIGTHSITAQYGGDTFDNVSTSAAFIQHVLPASSTSLTASPNPSVFGQSVTFTARVTAISGTPTGIVKFEDAGTTLGTGTLSAGKATFTTAALSAGTHSITGIYSGDANFGGSTSPVLTETVKQAVSSTSLASSLNPSTFEAAVTFTATVTSTGGTPTGSVAFKAGTTTLGTGTLNAGKATLTTTALSVGTHAITAVYGGSTNFAGSTSPALSQVVKQAATTTSVVSSVNPSAFGQSVTFTATVKPATSGTPTGTVTFKDGATTLGTGTLSGGKATFTTSSLTKGSHAITASYGGDANFTASTSLTLIQTVKTATSTAVASSVNPSAFGQAVKFTATVKATSGTPTGTVTFKNGTTTLGTGTLSAGKSTLTTAALAVGTHSITAVYSGDANFAGSTSPALSQVVKQAATTTSVVSSVNPSAGGQPVTFTATVTATTSGTPTGSVQFNDGGTQLGMRTLVGGKATFTTNALAFGPHSITAVYLGSVDYLGSTSPVLTQQVN
jgi:Big-like domain-containing protein/ASPM-SPD-2-Hydin domain-containing protein